MRVDLSFSKQIYLKNNVEKTHFSIKKHFSIKTARWENNFAKMVDLLDMNDDCLKYLLQFCDADSIVAVSQTCTRLEFLAIPFFKNHTKYDGAVIASREDEARVKKTLRSIGNQLAELNVNIAPENNTLESVFFERLPQKCQHLETLRVTSHVKTNILLRSVRTLHQLKYLSIRWLDHDVDEWEFRSLARSCTQLESIKIRGKCLNLYTIFHFLCEAHNLLRFECNYLGVRFVADHEFLETFRASEKPFFTLNAEVAELFQ